MLMINLLRLSFELTVGATHLRNSAKEALRVTNRRSARAI
jgi:hypothetical protein